MKIHDAAFVDGSVEFVDIVGKHHAMVLDNIRSTTHACGGIVAMLGHLVTGTGNDEARGRRDVKRILTIAACTNDVDVTVAVERHRYASLQDTVTEAEKFINRDAAHLNGRQQCRDFWIREFTTCDGNQQFLCLLTFQLFMIEQPIENVHNVHSRIFL